MKKMIPLSIPNFSGNEKKYVIDAIDTAWVSTAGKQIEQFEDQVADYVGSAGAVACQSGTAGLHLAMLALGIKKKDIVLAPTLTFVAAVNPIKYVGATPVFFDCDEFLTIDSQKIEKFCEEECEMVHGKLIHIKSQKRVKAMVAVHVFGNMSDMETLMKIADRYHLLVIEDATEAFGTYYLEGIYAGKYAGTIGDIGVFSFNGNKIITTGGGGMIVSNNKPLLKECKHLSTQAKLDSLYFDHDEIGYNYRMTNLQAALRLAQLEQIEKFIQVKKRNYELYNNLGISLLPFRKNIRSNYWFYSYKTEDRDGLIHYLNDREIQSRPIWKLIHTLKPYQREQVCSFHNANYFYKSIINLPCSSDLSEKDVRYVVKCIKDFEEEHILNEMEMNT